VLKLTWICKFCGRKFKTDEGAVRHIVAVCQVPRSKQKRQEYWRWIVKRALEMTKELLAETFEIEKLNIHDYRALMLLHAIRLVDFKQLDMKPEETERILAAYVPEIFIYLMEYAGLIEITPDGKVKLKEESKKWQEVEEG